MVITFKSNEKSFRADLSKPLDISIPIKEGKDNPNCYWADDVKFQTIRSGDFVGSVAEGGTVNYQKVFFTPHGNGTHTECYGHITSDKDATISKKIESHHFLSYLMSIEPEILGNDSIVTFAAFKKKMTDEKVGAVIIRTLPNDTSKRTKKHSGTNPTYIDHRVAQFLNKNGVEHLIVDLPSVDKELDRGMLLAHKAFWGVPNNIRESTTITELAYIDNKIKDGIYLLNLQTSRFELDACPSRPVLYEVF